MNSDSEVHDHFNERLPAEAIVFANLEDAGEVAA